MRGTAKPHAKNRNYIRYKSYAACNAMHAFHHRFKQCNSTIQEPQETSKLMKLLRGHNRFGSRLFSAQY